MNVPVKQQLLIYLLFFHTLKLKDFRLVRSEVGTLSHSHDLPRYPKNLLKYSKKVFALHYFPTAASQRDNSQTKCVHG